MQNQSRDFDTYKASRDFYLGVRDKEMTVATGYREAAKAAFNQRDFAWLKECSAAAATATRTALDAQGQIDELDRNQEPWAQHKAAFWNAIGASTQTLIGATRVDCTSATASELPRVDTKDPRRFKLTVRGTGAQLNVANMAIKKMMLGANGTPEMIEMLRPSPLYDLGVKYVYAMSYDADYGAGDSEFFSITINFIEAMKHEPPKKVDLLRGETTSKEQILTKDETNEEVDRATVYAHEFLRVSAALDPLDQREARLGNWQLAKSMAEEACSTLYDAGALHAAAQQIRAAL
jgi:hypothetical protein